MAFTVNSSDQNERTSKEAPQLCALSKETKKGLDSVRSKVQALTLNDMEGKPEEVREVVGDESREPIEHRLERMIRARREAGIFPRVSLTEAEKKQGKLMKKSRKRLVGSSGDFCNDTSLDNPILVGFKEAVIDDFRRYGYGTRLPLNEDVDAGNSNRGGKKQFKRKTIII